MKLVKTWRALALGLSLLAGAPALSAAEETPDVLIKRISEDVLNIVRTDKDIQSGNTRKAIDLIEAKVLPHFDFARMTALAVGKDWHKANAEQKKKLIDAFRTLLVRTYSSALTSYKNQTVVYKPFTMQTGETDVLVRTEIRQPGQQAIALDYGLEKQGESWKIYDVVVAGISLVTNYRENFTQEIRANGVDGLIASITTKNKQLEAAKSSEKKS